MLRLTAHPFSQMTFWPSLKWMDARDFLRESGYFDFDSVILLEDLYPEYLSG